MVFVGKSLTAVGGQNPIEPGALGKAMVFGPNMQNFADIARNFRRGRTAAVQVRDPEELEKVIAELLADESRRAELGRNALQGGARKSGRDGPHGGNDLGETEAARNLHRAAKNKLSFRRLTKPERLFIFPHAFGFAPED